MGRAVVDVVVLDNTEVPAFVDGCVGAKARDVDGSIDKTVKANMAATVNVGLQQENVMA